MQFVGPFVSVYFLGSSLTFMLVYLWGRRNPQVGMNFLGLFTFNADFLPWVLLGLSLLLNHNIVADLIGIAVGHVYYFLEDVYPKPEAQGGLGGPKLLKTPGFVNALFEGAGDDPNYDFPEELRGAGGFQWGEGRQVGGEDEDDNGGGGQ